MSLTEEQRAPYTRPVVHLQTNAPAPGWRVTAATAKELDGLTAWADNIASGGGRPGVVPGHFQRVEVQLIDGTWERPDCGYHCEACGGCLGCIKKLIDPSTARFHGDAVTCPASDTGQHAVPVDED